MPQADPQMGVLQTPELQGFRRIKELEAQLKLYRGFLHEVNNALAGIGTLAEMMKAKRKGEGAKTEAKTDSKINGEADSKNLELMINATGRSATLQRRIRALYEPSEITFDIELSEFLLENQDLMELMLPHSQRLSFAIAPGVPQAVNTSPDELWRWLSLMLLWLRETEVSRAQVIWTHQGTFKLELNTAALPKEDALWRQLLNDVARSMKLTLDISSKGIEAKVSA